MKKIIINGKDFENKEVLHEALKDKLDFPDYYGKNLDALWDCLTGWIELPLTLVWRNFEFSKKFLDSYADNTLEVLQEAQEELEDEFKIIVE
ncbi:barstar family protein [Bacillus spizizenii]|uniref:barstar family protein n=1 Tax=Bacillus spizizenii TaxID=96241 RepID=UPI002DB77290|nr:barstar family protein [Bacillus spizizenii]MEC2182134.1 barstar family protein [Bacillus spizizenii]